MARESKRDTENYAKLNDVRRWSQTLMVFKKYAIKLVDCVNVTLL
jgi:hypothetical protein